MCVASRQDNQLLVGFALGIETVAEPAEAVLDLSVPRALVLPIDLLDILDRVESKIDAQRDLRREHWRVRRDYLARIVLLLASLLFNLVDVQIQVELLRRHLYWHLVRVNLLVFVHLGTHRRAQRQILIWLFLSSFAQVLVKVTHYLVRASQQTMRQDFVRQP